MLKLYDNITRNHRFDLNLNLVNSNFNILIRQRQTVNLQSRTSISNNLRENVRFNIHLCIWKTNRFIQGYHEVNKKFWVLD